jgi:hypothetical protein
MTVRFLAVILTALALIAPGAHLFEMLNKMRLSEEHYFIVQGIYNGWWIAGLLLPAAFVANLALAYAARGDRTSLLLALGAAALIAVNLTIFIIWTQPANAATQNWTVRPENWQLLRAQWEYSHAANAGVILLALGCATVAALRPASS